jgi:peptidoglycan/xylan/chitin deacetylase (PgdA/CDA1 family)
MRRYQKPHERSARKARHKRTLRWVVGALTGALLLAAASFGGYFLYSQQHKKSEAAKNTSATSTSTAPRPQKVETPSIEKQPVAMPAPPKHDVRIPPVENGLAPVISALPTKEPVVFLTIDDGAYKDPAEVELMKKHNLKASLFLTYNVIKSNPSFFKDFIALGSLVENHTITHSYLSQLSYAGQKQEICGQADKMQELYGRRPVLFRPPGGFYNDTTRRAAADCGMKAVVMWTAKANGGSMQYQVGNRLRAGDIVLMHFRPEFRQDLESFVTAMHVAGLRTELLEDWLQE